MNNSQYGTLLIVDDEPLKRATLDIELSAAGYRVLQAADPITALQYLEEQPVDVVVTDWRMPEMDGIQLLERIKTRWPQVHVILMTAYSSVDSAVQAMRQGAYDYLSKPFTTDILIRKLKGLLNGGEDIKPEPAASSEPATRPDDLAAAAVEGHAPAEAEPVDTQGNGAAAARAITIKLPEAVAGVERSLIDAALRRAAGNQAKAAQYLGIPRTTLRDKLAKYGMMTGPADAS